MDDDRGTYCQNCRRDVPTGNFEIHAIHCRRNLQICEKCNEPVPRNSANEHNAEFHTVIKCSECRIDMENYKLETHKAKECPKRTQLCEFCELELKADAFLEHTDYCGSRTEICEGCDKHVMIKFQQLHLDSNHRKLKPVDLHDTGDDNVEESQMSASRNRNGFEVAIPDLNDVFNNMDLRNATVRVNEHLQRNANGFQLPNRSRREMESPGNLVDETLIPCEFCNLPIIVDDLVLHQTGCRPDLLSYSQDDSTAAALDTKNYQAKVEFKNNIGDEVMIPCEFCNESFPLQYLSNHQLSCGRRNYSSSNNTSNTHLQYVDSDDDFM